MSGGTFTIEIHDILVTTGTPSQCSGAGWRSGKSLDAPECHGAPKQRRCHRVLDVRWTCTRPTSSGAEPPLVRMHNGRRMADVGFDIEAAATQ